MKHTQGKWYTNNDGDTITVNVYKYVENGYITTIDGVNAEANASRIVDCVNNCEGINPEIIPDLLEKLKDYVEWHEAAIPKNHRDDYEKEYLIEGSKFLIAKAEEK